MPTLPGGSRLRPTHVAGALRRHVRLAVDGSAVVQSRSPRNPLHEWDGRTRCKGRVSAEELRSRTLRRCETLIKSRGRASTGLLPSLVPILSCKDPWGANDTSPIRADGEKKKSGPGSVAKNQEQAMSDQRSSSVLPVGSLLTINA